MAVHHPFPRLRFSFLAGAIVIVVFLAHAAPVSAQMPAPLLSLAGRDWTPDNTCADAPPPCTGETSNLELGMHEFVLSRVTSWERPTEMVEVTLHWPDAWSFLGWESCAGTLISGDPSVAGSLLRFSFDDCPDESPFLRVWMDCPTPGSFSATPGDLIGCGAYEGLEELMGLYVDIGDWCGAAPHGHCDLCAYHSAAGYFDPHFVDLILPQGAVWEDTLGVSGDTGPYCPGLPECCSGYGAGLVGVHGEEPWIEASIIDYGGQGYEQLHYRLVIRGDRLGPGEHSGKIWAEGGCCSRSNCIPVTVQVLAPADVQEAGPASHVLGAPHPNPTTGGIRFDIQMARPGRARVSVVDAAGRRIAIVLDRELPSGSTVSQWRPSDELRRALSSGVYFLSLESAEGRETRVFVFRR